MNTMNGMIKLFEFAVKLIGVLIIVLIFVYVRILSAKYKWFKKEIAYRNSDYDNKNNQEYDNNQEYNNLNNYDPINYYDDEKTDL